VHTSERMNDCPVVGGRKYDVECDGVRWGPIGSRWGPDWVPMGSDGVPLGPMGSDWVISHTVCARQQWTTSNQE